MVYIDHVELSAYFKKYLNTYMDTVKAKVRGQQPDFARDQPMKVDIRVLPNEAVAVFFYPNQPEVTVDVTDDTFEDVKAEVLKKGHKYFKIYYPTKNFSEKDAAADARDHVGKDTRSATYRAGLTSARSHVDDVIAAIQDSAKANPWLEEQLKDVKGRLETAQGPLVKLVEEYENLDKIGIFKEQVAAIDAIEQIDISDPQVLDNENLKTYLEAYIKGYKETIKPEYPERARPRFFKGMPVKVRASILSNSSVSVFFKFGAITNEVEVHKEKFAEAQAHLKNKEFDDYMHLPPLKVVTEDAGILDATNQVKMDVQNTLHLALISDTRLVIQDNKKKIMEITKTNPWLEDQMKNLSTRLEGVSKLLEVLVEELEASTLVKKPQDMERVFLEVSRFKAPKKAETRSEGPSYLETRGVEAPVIPAAPVISDESENYMVAPSWVPGSEVLSNANVGVYEDEKAGYGMVYAQPGMTDEERARMEELENQVFNANKRVDDFDRRLRYMDKYIEHEVQRRQDEKLRLQDEKVSHQISRTAAISYGLATVAILLTIGVLIINLGALKDALGGLFG